MRLTLLPLILGASLVSATSALADDDCDRPMGQWVSREAVVEKLRDMGIEPSRIRTDDGCYEAYGRNVAGERVKLELDPVTLEIREIEKDSPHHDRPKSRTPTPASPTAPANPLIGPSSGKTN